MQHFLQTYKTLTNEVCLPTFSQIVNILWFSRTNRWNSTLHFLKMCKTYRDIILAYFLKSTRDVRQSNFRESYMYLTFMFKVNRLGFRCFACNFQTVGPRTMHFGTQVNVDEVTSALKFEWITNALLLHFKGQTFNNFLLYITWSLDCIETDILFILLIIKANLQTFLIIYTWHDVDFDFNNG